MNKVFKVVWSATKHAYVVTSELAKSHQKSATTIVAGRAGTGSSLNSQIEYIENKYDSEIHRLNSPVLEISSNDIRRRVRDGESIRYLLPDKVEHYIYEHGLYQPDGQDAEKKEQ